MLPYVMGVSWPRSGHHLLAGLLISYFGKKELHYCGFYAEQLDCCRTVPCTRAGQINLSKSHDWELTAPKLQGQSYLIQFRRFIPSVISNYELHARNTKEDSAESFRRFAIRKSKQYCDFMNKWGDPGDPDARGLRLSYEKLIEDTGGSLAQAIQLFQPDESPDPERIARAMASVEKETVEKGKTTLTKGAGIRPKTDSSETFRHYDAALFKRLEEETAAAYEVAVGSPSSPQLPTRI